MLISGFLAGAAFTCAVYCAGLFVRRKDRDVLAMGVISLAACADALVPSRSVLSLSITLPVTAVLVAAVLVMLRRQRKQRT
jgi:hypothetical protein